MMATFEIGADTGDKPGELQFWVERAKLTQTLTGPGIGPKLKGKLRVPDYFGAGRRG